MSPLYSLRYRRNNTDLHEELNQIDPIRSLFDKPLNLHETGDRSIYFRLRLDSTLSSKRGVTDPSSSFAPSFKTRRKSYNVPITVFPKQNKINRARNFSHIATSTMFLYLQTLFLSNNSFKFTKSKNPQNLNLGYRSHFHIITRGVVHLSLQLFDKFDEILKR